ncbi:ABC transporter substrate binding protein [uncultured Thiodictyon sp.]|uniref:ABC transporter substrate-binding protein n=1 Tax=uncultured Thiodictyon sp. TaxID=1846217 RepID=UPI0025CE9080|nr:ABC transporter substrate binding protein [uncultured Thiodictyon sp.]
MTNCVSSWLLAAVLGFGAPAASAAPFKVLVVMSYEADNPWVKEIRAGVESVLGPVSEIVYFHLNTKVDRDGGSRRAQEAYDLYQRLQPQGVIAADDDAQAMFVVPFLRDKVGTPVMFNGVNAAPEQYGFPASNVSGILERAHVRESLAFIKQLLPAVQRACFITNDVPAGLALRTQVEEEQASYPAKVVAFHLVKRAGDIVALGDTLRAACDTLFIDSLEGILDADATPMNNAQVVELLGRIYPGPILGGNRYQVDQGAWAAVVKTGQEQGETSAEMLLRAMRGTPVAEIPVTRNSRGQRVINVTAIEAHEIPLRPTVLRGAALVRQQP